MTIMRLGGRERKMKSLKRRKGAIARSASVVHEKRRKMSRENVNVKGVNEGTDENKNPSMTKTNTTGVRPSFVRTLPTIPIFAHEMHTLSLMSHDPVFSVVSFSKYRKGYQHQSNQSIRRDPFD
jgi:hypothetical protein